MPEAPTSPFACCGDTIAHQQFSRIFVLHQNLTFKAQSTPEKGPYKECASSGCRYCQISRGVSIGPL
jgi:hypothetical protein